MKKTKSDIIRNLLKEYKYKEALRIMKSFGRFKSKHEKDIITRCYECFINPNFYATLDYDVEKEKEKAIKVIINRFKEKDDV